MRLINPIALPLFLACAFLPAAGLADDAALSKDLGAMETEASSAAAIMRTKLDRLDRLTQSLADGRDFDRLSAERAALRPEVEDLMRWIEDIRHRHLRARESMNRAKMLAVLNAARRTGPKPGFDAAIFASMRFDQYEQVLGRFNERAGIAVVRNDLAYQTAEESRRALLWPMLAVAVLLLIAAAAGVFVFLKRRPRLRPGSILQGNFRVGRRLAAGEASVVYEAADISLGRKVALKCIRDAVFLDPKRREAFLQAARAAATLKHPNIADIYAVFQEDARVFLVLELVEGRPLSFFLDSRRAFSPDLIKSVVLQLVSALDYAHARGIAHGGLKPSDVMLTREGAVKLLGFAMARLGAPPGEAAPASDIRSLGELLGAMALGRSPKSPEEAASLAAPYGDIVRKATAADPRARYRTAWELAAALKAFPGK